MMADASKPYAPTYKDELAITKHFVSVLERNLGGRNHVRRAYVHPLDWCHLGVLGPSKLGHAPVELEAEQIEGELGPQTSLEPIEAGERSTSTAPSSAPPPMLVSTSDTTKSDPSSKDTDSAPVVDRGEDRQGTRRPPSALGFEILLKPDQGGFVELIVDVSFCLFTKHLPTLKEQSSREAGTAGGAPLAEVVQRWPIQVKGIRFRFQPTSRESFIDEGVVQNAIDSALNEAFDRTDSDRVWPGARPRVPAAALKDEVSFGTFVASASATLQAERWTIRGAVELRVSPRSDDLIRLGCYIRNDTPETARIKGKGLKDAFLVIGDAEIRAEILTGELHPIEILPVPVDYQYDRRVWAVGHNTSVRADREKNAIRTAALAQYEQVRTVTRDRPAARFAELASNPFVTLAAVHSAMLAFEKDWRDHILVGNVMQLEEDALAECAKDHAAFVDEIRRFSTGIAALEADERLLRAFAAANRVFGKLARGYDSWRLFQLVFIVTQLPALAIREGISSAPCSLTGANLDWSDALDWGDVLWFRTGGGKTEAYLGLACCAILYDRLRGKNFGVTAWLRFPLRMLSIQQLQRAMKVIWEAEQERLSLLGDDAKNSDSIRLGYFVGGTTTPNGLTDELLQKYKSAESLEWLRVVPDCPSCDDKGTVQVSTDTTARRFRHICSACKCELPLDVSDDEVYRYLPALVVGTIDKMATVGQQVKYGLLWGGAKHKCALHGYYGQYCIAFPCKPDKKTRTAVVPYDPSPALHIQDELHLLQEELGAFAGHYETLIRYCEETLSGKPSKVIAATATIEGFERQVRHLYGVKDARRFPGRGYHQARTFYSEPDVDVDGAQKTARLFVAFKSSSLTPADASAYCTEILQTEIARLIRNPNLPLEFLHDAKSIADVAALLRYYTTTLNYVGSLARGSRVKQALQDVAAEIRPDGARDFNVEYHSSRSTSAEVANVVHRIETPPTWSDSSFLDALVATSMISHGVDLERVNLMAMDGVPEETAEYIQASSRSGRKHVGMVIVVLAGYSVRATSIYHRFLEYHQHLDRMVSPVPVNRFAKYAVQRTLPGVALGLVYGRHAAASGNFGLNKTNEVSALFEQLGSELMDQLRSAYSLGRDIYDERLERALETTLATQLEIVRLSVRNSQEKYVKDAIRPSPMTSLRDVEAGVAFWPEGDSRLLTFVQKTRE